MITENVRKQLADYRKHGKKLKYLINYLMGLIDDEDDFENIIIREMKALAFNEDEIVDYLQKQIHTKGLIAFADGSYLPCGYAIPRIQEIYSCFNRYRQ